MSELESVAFGDVNYVDFKLHTIDKLLGTAEGTARAFPVQPRTAQVGRRWGGVCMWCACSVRTTGWARGCNIVNLLITRAVVEELPRWLIVGQGSM